MSRFDYEVYAAVQDGLSRGMSPREIMETYRLYPDEFEAGELGVCVPRPPPEEPPDRERDR